MANVFFCTGRLTKDPEIRFTAGEKSMCIANMTVAVDKWSAKTGKGTDFLRITAFGKLAETIEKYCAKGMMIGVTGGIHTDNYEKDGKKIYTTNLIAEKLDFLSKAEKTEEDASSEPPKGFTHLDDDIPF